MEPKMDLQNVIAACEQDGCAIFLWGGVAAPHNVLNSVVNSWEMIFIICSFDYDDHEKSYYTVQNSKPECDIFLIICGLWKMLRG